MDKKFLMLGLFLTSSVFGMNIDDCNLNYNAQQQTTLAEDVQEGDFCSGLTSYNGELGYYLLRLDDEEGLKHVRKLSLEELIYFNGWTQTLPRTEEEFFKFAEDIAEKGPLGAYARYRSELAFYCINNEKDLLNAKIEDGKLFASLLMKYRLFYQSDNFYNGGNYDRMSFCNSIEEMFLLFTDELEKNEYNTSSMLFADLAYGLNSIDEILCPNQKRPIRVPYAPYYTY